MGKYPISRMRDIDVLVMPNRYGQNIYDFKVVRTVR